MRRRFTRRLPPRLTEAVREYIDRGSSVTPVVMSDLILKVRKTFPEMELSDKELTDILAQMALERSDRPVLFDSIIKQDKLSE